jgi:hypothetical protein
MYRLQKPSTSFTSRLIAVDDFLPQADFAFLRDTALNLADAKRVHIPLHKRGATISYHSLLHTDTLEARRMSNHYEHDVLR